MRADLRDQARFRVLIDRKDPFLNTPPGRLLKGLRGKDVLLVFVESYGQMAVQGTSFSPGIDEIVKAGTQQLQAQGFSSRSGWLISSTFGGGSWLAHATLQSGIWVNSPSRYSALIASKRLTLRRRVPARRVEDGRRRAVDPRLLAGGEVLLPLREDLGPRQPRVSRPEIRLLRRCPTSTRSRRCRSSSWRSETAGRSTPRSITTSSHEPWTRIPPLISWNRLGNGSIFDRLPIDRAGLTDTQQGYARSIQYSLRVLYSFVERYGNKNTVLIVLGDHQPSRVVGEQPGHEVPITIIAHDPNVISRLSSWDWTTGHAAQLDGTGLADERLPEPFPQRVRPLESRDPAARNAVPKSNSAQETIGQLIPHSCANRLPRTAHDPLVDRSRRAAQVRFRAVPTTEARCPEP